MQILVNLEQTIFGGRKVVNTILELPKQLKVPEALLNATFEYATSMEGDNS